MKMDMIELYEEHKNVLLEAQEDAIKELWFMQVKGLIMNEEQREFMTEVMGVITYLNNCICLTDIKIKRLNEDLLKGVKA